MEQPRIIIRPMLGTTRAGLTKPSFGRFYGSSHPIHVYYRGSRTQNDNPDGYPCVLIWGRQCSMLAELPKNERIMLSRVFIIKAIIQFRKYYGYSLRKSRRFVIP